MTISHQATIRANPIRYYCLSLLDKHHNPNISLEEGMDLLARCTDELKRRLPIDYKGVCLTLQFPSIGPY